MSVRWIAAAGLLAGCHATLADVPGGGDAGSSVADAAAAITDGAGPADAPADADDPALVSHWTFDDDPVDGVLDATGRHAASCEAACPTPVTGKIGGGYHFDPAAQQALVVPDSPDFRGNFTIAAWFRADAGTSSISIMAKPVGTGSENSWQLELRDTGALSFSGGTVHYLNSPATVPRQAWHHAAGTWDGATKRLYIDGVEVANVASTSSFDGHAIYLGADQNSGTTVLYWAGTLDDVRVYSRVLSAAEIAALAQ